MSPGPPLRFPHPPMFFPGVWGNLCRDKCKGETVRRIYILRRIQPHAQPSEPKNNNAMVDGSGMM